MTCVQLLERALPDWEVNISRNVGIFACTAVVVRVRAIPVFVEHPRDIPLVALSAFCTISTSYLCIVSVDVLPLSVIYSTSASFSLILGTIIYRVVLKEDITVVKCLSTVLCIGGILATVQPDFSHWKQKIDVGPDYSEHANASEHLGTLSFNSTLSPSEEKITSVAIVFGYICAIAHGSFTAIRYTTLKLLSNRNLSTFTSVFWGSFVGLVASVIITCATKATVVFFTLKEILLLTIYAIATSLRITCLLLQVDFLDSTVSNILLVTFSATFTILSQYTVLRNIMPGHRNLLEVFGVALVVVAATLTACVELIKAKHQDKPKDNNDKE